MLSRIADLYKPFGNFYYYHFSQKGSTSVKSVLPAITGLSYRGMEIAGGIAASVYFLYICGYYNLLNNSPGILPLEEEIAGIRKSQDKNNISKILLTFYFKYVV